MNSKLTPLFLLLRALIQPRKKTAPRKLDKKLLECGFVDPRGFLCPLFPRDNFLFQPSSVSFISSELSLSFLSHSFPYLVSDTSCRLDFPMQRYSGRPSSSTAMLTARGFARQPSQIEDVLSVPRLAAPSGWVFREIPGCLLVFPSFPRCLACM